MRRDAADKAAAAFLKDLRSIRWTKREIEAAMAGWEYALEQMADFKTDSYVLSRMPDDGSDEARDLAACSHSGKDVEKYADCCYEGILAARKFVREAYGGED